MEISSGLQREFWMDLTASSAVKRPIASASLRSVVVWIGVRSMRWTYSGARVPLRFTFTRNLVFFMLSPLRLRDNRRRQNEGGLHNSPLPVSSVISDHSFKKRESMENFRLGWLTAASMKELRRDISLSYNPKLPLNG